MRTGGRTHSKGRGQQQGGGSRRLNTPPLKKTSNLKFKAKVTKKESVGSASSSRRSSSGRTQTKRFSSTSCSESSPKTTSVGASSRGRSAKSSSQSPGRASAQASPSGKASGKSPAQRSPGRSPTRGPLDGAKVTGKGAKSPTKSETDNLKSLRIVENSVHQKAKSVSDKQEMPKVGRDTSSEGNKSASQSAKSPSQDKGKKSVVAGKSRRNSESKNDSNGKSSDEKEESDKDGKKKGKKVKDLIVEKQEIDKEFKKKTGKKVDEKKEENKVARNKSKKNDEKDESQKDLKKKTKKAVEEKDESENSGKKKEEYDKDGRKKEESVRDAKTKEESDKDIKKKVVDDNRDGKKKELCDKENKRKDECEEERKKKEDCDKDGKRKGKRVGDEKGESDREGKKGKRTGDDKEENDRENKESYKILDIKVGDAVSRVVEKEVPSSSTKDSGQLHKTSSKEKLDRVMLKNETKELSEDGNSSTSKPKKKGVARKLLVDSEGENSLVHSRETIGKDDQEKKASLLKKENGALNSDSKDSKSRCSSSVFQNTPVPKKRGRPKGSKNKRKNDGLPPARPKKDKNKADKKQNSAKPNTKSKRERSVFSFSESEGEKDEKPSKRKKKTTKPSNKVKREKDFKEEEDEDNSSSDSISSDEDPRDSFHGIRKGKLCGNRSECPKKVVIGGKIYKLKKESTKSRVHHKKIQKSFLNKKLKKQTSEASESAEDSEDKRLLNMKVSKIAKVRSDDSESSDNEETKKTKTSPKRIVCINEETSDEEVSDDDEDWATAKERGRQIKNLKVRKGLVDKRNKNKTLKSKMIEKSDEEKDDESEEEEEEDDGDYEDNVKQNGIVHKSNKKGISKEKKCKTNQNQKQMKEKSSAKNSIKSESSSEENDEEDQDTLKKSRKKMSYKNSSSRVLKKSSKGDSKAVVKKTKKVTSTKKGTRGKDDTSEVDESDKESDSEYEANTRKKKSGKSILKTKKHMLKSKKREESAAPPRRAARMASLNARAMMHCINEDARTPLPVLPASTSKNENMALVLRDQVIHDTNSEEDSDEEDRDYDTDDDKHGKRRKNVKRKNEEETEKKVKKKRKRRRGELDVHMDMCDMVVTKRMASLNASAIMAASYSNESRKRTPTAAATSSSAESEITNVDIKRKISVKSTKARNTTTSSVITVEETTKKVKKAQGSRETEVEERIIVKKKVKRQGAADTDREDGNGTDNSELTTDILARSEEEPKSVVEESTRTYITTQTSAAPQTVTISGESTYCITSSDGKTTTMVKQVQRKTTTTGCSTTTAPPTAYIPPTHHVQPQPHTSSYSSSPQKPDNYTPLGALSTMQPVMSPGGTPHHHHHHHHHHHQAHPPPHHQPPPPPHHQPPPPQPPPPPPHHPPPPPSHHPPPHHHPPSSHHPPPHNYPQPHHHHPHHQPYPPPPPTSHPHGAAGPLGHHCGYRPPPVTPPSGNTPIGNPSQGNTPTTGPPMAGPTYPNHSSPGYLPPSHAVAPTHSAHPPHHSPKQLGSPNHVSPSLKNTAGNTGIHPPPGSPRAVPVSGQVERHHSAFTAPAPSTHSPAASTPAGYQPVSGPMPVKANYTATTSDGTSPYKAPKGSPVAAAPPYSSPPRLTSPPLPIKAPPNQSGSEPYTPPYQYPTYSYHPAPPPPPHVAPYDKYYPRGATYHFYPPTYSGGQYAAPGAEYSYPPPPAGGVHYSQESYTSYTLCVPNPPPQGPPQALALPPPPPPTSNGPHPPAYATYHYTEYTPVFTYPPPGTIVKINFIGPSSQSTICCPVDPKNVHTWPPTGSGRGPEAATNSASQCSSMGQGGGPGYQYQYHSTQQPPPHPPHTGTQQGCGAASVYHTGPLTTVMTTGTQPTIQVFGAVVPQQTVTLMPSQDPQTVTAPPPNVPPPVPAPVPPDVPISQPHPTTTTTMVAMAPITVTVPINPGAPVGSQSVVQSGSIPTQASTTASGVPEHTVAAPQETTTYVSRIPQPAMTPAHVTSAVTSEVPKPTISPSKPTAALVSEAKQNALASAHVSTAVVTGIPQLAVIPSGVNTAVVTGVPQSVKNPSRHTSAVVAGAPQPVVTPSQDITNISRRLSQPVATPSQVTTAVTPRVPQQVLSHQVTSAVVTGVPQPAAVPTQATTALVTAIPQCVVTPTQVTTAVVTAVPHPVVAPTQVTTAVVTAVPQPAVAPTQVTTAVVTAVRQPAVAPTQATTPAITAVPQPAVAPTQVTNDMVTAVLQPLLASTQVTTAVVTTIPQQIVPPTQITTAVVTGIPQPIMVPLQVTAVPSEIPTTNISSVCPHMSQTRSADIAVSGVPQSSLDEAEVRKTTDKFHTTFTHVNTAGVSSRPPLHVASSQNITACTSMVSSQAATAVVTGVQKAHMDLKHGTTAAVTSVLEPHKFLAQATTAVLTGVPKLSLASTQANTAIVSGVPRLSVRPTQVTTVSISGISNPLSNVSQVTTTTSAEVQKGADLSAKTTTTVIPEKLQNEVSLSNGTSYAKRVTHTGASSQDSEPSSLDATKSFSITASPQQKCKDILDVVEVESHTTTARVVLDTIQSVTTLGTSLKDGIRNTCSVPPMDEGGVVIKELPSAMKRKTNPSVSILAVESHKSVNTATSAQVAPDLMNVDSRPNKSWSPTQTGITSETPPFPCASNAICDAQTTTSVTNVCLTSVPETSGSFTGSASDLVCSPRMSVSSSVVAPSARSRTLSGLSDGVALNPSKPTVATQTTSTAPTMCKSTMAGSNSQQGTISVRDKLVMSVQCKVAQTKDSDTTKNFVVSGGTPQLGYQRPGPRHLLCQTLPTPTATAHLAKAKSSSSSSAHRMLVKSEDRNKDMKPNIPENVPISQSNSGSFEVSASMISIGDTQKSDLGSDMLDVKTDIISSAPLVRKRGRPPKTRDTSSDSNISETSFPNPDPTSDHKSTTVKPCIQSVTQEKNVVPCESELLRNRTTDLNSQGKNLRSQTEDKKKEYLQSSKMSISPSKQVDCKHDIKPSDPMKMMSIKTEVLPKIKTEKVSPKGVTKISSPLKVSPKEIPLFKTKIINGQGELSLKSGSLSRKCEVPSPTKAVGFTDSLKLTKGLRDVKKSPLGLLSDQRVPKNSVVASKSKFKEAFDKKLITSTNNVKRRNNESLGTSANKVLLSTKTSVTEGASKALAGTKNQTLKSQKSTKSSKSTSRRSPPNGKLNRKKSLLAYLKEKNNESDTSSVDSEIPSGGRKKSKSKEESQKSNSASPFPTFPPLPINAGSRRRSATAQGKCKSAKKPRWVHNWSWEGEPFEGKIWLRNDELELVRTCYTAMRHKEGDVVRVRDCVLLRSGPRKTDLPFVAKIAALWEDPETSDMMMSILWYYRPEHTDSGRRPDDLPDEIFASKHRDHLSVACIEDRCYVLTFNEYCRYRRFLRLFQEGVCPIATPVPDPEEGYCRKDRQPPGCVVPELLFFCRRVYDYRIKRLLKNPY